MEKTLEVHLLEQRNKIVAQIKALPCFCSPAPNRFDGPGICWRCQCVNIVEDVK